MRTDLIFSFILAIFSVILGVVSFFCWYRMKYSLSWESTFPEFPSPPSLGRLGLDQPDFSNQGDSINSTQFSFTGNREVSNNDQEVTLTVGEAIQNLTVARENELVYVRGKECGVMIYLNKVLRVLFTVFALLTVILSVVLDNSYNDRPLRFIPFGILAPFTISFGFLASGWFPRIPLRFIACVKRCGFLKHVMPCSPWHDNVLTDFTGEICTLKPIEQAQGTSELPQLVQNFLYGDPVCPQATAITQSALHPESEDFQEAESTLDPQTEALQDASTLGPESQVLSIQDSEDMSGTMQSPTVDVMATGQVSSPNLQEAPPQAEKTVIEIDRASNLLEISDDGCLLTFKGLKILEFSLEVQAFKSTSSRDNFELSYTFKNKKTQSCMYLNTRRLHNLAQNMFRWVGNPHPIVAEESSGILHCMSIQDILWDFTKSVYSLESVHVQHRFLAGMKEVKQFATMLYVVVMSLLGLIPLISDKKSLWFLFLVIPIVIRILMEPGHLICYYFKTLLCPIFIRVRGFEKLYKSRSFFIWCNEFRKQRVVNPRFFVISQEYANSFFDRETCFEVTGSVELPNIPTNVGQSFAMTCEGCPSDPTNPVDPAKPKQHAYKLVVIFDTVNNGCYINLRLNFQENNELLDTKCFFGPTEIQRLLLIEKLFGYYSDPDFGGYIETIYPSFRSYLAHCPRFLDVCAKIITEDTIPTLLIVGRKPKSPDIIIGDSFIS